MKVLRILAAITFSTQFSFSMERHKIPTPPPLPINEPKQTPPSPEKPHELNAFLDEYKYKIGAGIIVVGATSIALAARKPKRNALGYLPNQK